MKLYYSYITLSIPVYPLGNLYDGIKCFSAVVTLYATLGEDGIIHGINETESTHLITSYDLMPRIAVSLSSLAEVQII